MPVGDLLENRSQFGRSHHLVRTAESKWGDSDLPRRPWGRLLRHRCGNHLLVASAWMVSRRTEPSPSAPHVSKRFAFGGRKSTLADAVWHRAGDAMDSPELGAWPGPRGSRHW